MFGRTRARLSLQFNRQTITTHRFERKTSVGVADEFTGKLVDIIPALSRVWAEATPVGKNKYTITEKRLVTHHQGAAFVSGWSALYKEPMGRQIDRYNTKTEFTRAEAIGMLMAMENRFQEDGYKTSRRQPFKKRRYTEQETYKKQKLQIPQT